MAIETWKVDDIEFTIERKPRQKHLYIKFDPQTAAIHVSAPKHMARSVILAFVRSKSATLKERQAQAYRRLKAAPKLVTGDTVPLWGEEKTLVIEETESNKASYAFEGDTLTLTLNRNENDKESKMSLLRAWYKEELYKKLPELTRTCEAKTGLQATSYRVRDMKTRWGSCTHKTGRIRLATKLAMYPEACLTYVIIHELVHLVEPNHGPGFYKRLETYLPEWKKYRAMLQAGQPFHLN